MAIAHVGDINTDGTVASPGPTLTYSSTGGNTLVAAGVVFTGTTSVTGITSVTDSAGNTWTVATANSQNPPSVRGTDGTNFYVVFIAYVLGASAVTSVTVSDGTGHSDFWNVQVSEWSGVNSAEQASAASGTGANPSLTWTIGNAGDLVIAYMDSSAGSPSFPANLTHYGSNPGNIFGGYAFPGATGSFSAAWTMASSDYGIAGLVLSPAGGTSAPAGNAASSGAVTAAAGALALNMTIQGH